MLPPPPPRSLFLSYWTDPMPTPSLYQVRLRDWQRKARRTPTTYLRFWQSALDRAYPVRGQRQHWAILVCATAALVRVLRLEDLLMGVWERWMRTGAHKRERGTWLHANMLGGGGGASFIGIKGATIVAALKWRFPPLTWFFVRRPHPIQPQASLPQGWGTFLMPMRDARYDLPKCDAGKRWNPWPAVWAANP